MQNWRDNYVLICTLVQEVQNQVNGWICTHSIPHVYLFKGAHQQLIKYSDNGFVVILPSYKEGPSPFKHHSRCICVVKCAASMLIHMKNPSLVNGCLNWTRLVLLQLIMRACNNNKKMPFKNLCRQTINRQRKTRGGLEAEETGNGGNERRKLQSFNAINSEYYFANPSFYSVRPVWEQVCLWICRYYHLKTDIMSPIKQAPAHSSLWNTLENIKSFPCLFRWFLSPLNCI